MFGMFPFKDLNNKSLFEGIDSIIDNLISSDFVNNIVNDFDTQVDYDINFRDFGEYYLIKGLLPGLTAKDVSIDFEKNKAILTIRKRQVYKNNSNSVMAVIQTGGNLVKNFYIEEVDVTKLSASFDNSLLVITLPKVKKIQENNKVEGDEPVIIDVENYKTE